MPSPLYSHNGGRWKHALLHIFVRRNFFIETCNDCLHCLFSGLRAVARSILAWSNRPVVWASRWRATTTKTTALTKPQPAPRVLLLKRRRPRRPPMDDIERGDTLPKCLQLYWLLIVEGFSTFVSGRIRLGFYLMSLLFHNWGYSSHISSSLCLCHCVQNWWQRYRSWTSWAAATAPQTPTPLPAATAAPAAVTQKTNGLLQRPQPPPAPAPANHSMPIINTSSRHQESGGLMSTLSE